MTEEYIKDFSGYILGYIVHEDNGDEKVVDFDTRKVLGYYKASENTTREFSGKIVGRGNRLSELLYKEKNKNK